MSPDTVLGGVDKFLTKTRDSIKDTVSKTKQVGKNFILAGAKTLNKNATFKKGGRVKRTGKALVHKGEFILPKGIPPTKIQIKKVCKRGGIV